MSTTTPCIQPIQALPQPPHDALGVAAGRLAARGAAGRRAAARACTRHVVGGDQHQDQRPEHARHAQADRGDRADQRLRDPRCSARRTPGPGRTPRPAWPRSRPRPGRGGRRRSRGTSSTNWFVCSTNGGMISAMSTAITSRPPSSAAQHAERPRQPAALEPVGDRRQRDRDDHRDQHRQQQRDELAEEQPEHEQARGQEHRAVGDLGALGSEATGTASDELRVQGHAAVHEQRRARNVLRLSGWPARRWPRRSPPARRAGPMGSAPPARAASRGPRSARWLIGVRIAPGATITTRIPRGASSRAIVWPKSFRPPLLAQ